MKILVRTPNWLGDAVMALPALRTLRNRLPNADITLLARAWVADLYRRESCADRVIVYPGVGGPRGWRERLKLARQLQRDRCDWALVFPNSWESALLPWAARIPRRTGYERRGRGYLLTDRIAPPQRGEVPQHESFYYLELLRRSGVIERLPEPSPILLSGIQQARSRGAGLFESLGLEGPVIGLSPGAQNSRAKQWPAGRFVQAAASLAGQLGAAVAVFGSAAERPLGRHVAAELRRHGCHAINLAGETTLEDFIALAAACRVFLSNDSGAMHLASALGVPTVAVFGPTEWFATAPAGPRSVIVREPVECSPCMLRDCPTDHRCMLRIPAERVAKAALDLIEWDMEGGHTNQDLDSGSREPGAARAHRAPEGGHRVL